MGHADLAWFALAYAAAGLTLCGTQAVLWHRGVPLRRGGAPEGYTIIACFHLLVATLAVVSGARNPSPDLSGRVTLVGFVVGLAGFAVALLLMARRAARSK